VGTERACKRESDQGIAAQQTAGLRGIRPIGCALADWISRVEIPSRFIVQPIAAVASLGKIVRRRSLMICAIDDIDDRVLGEAIVALAFAPGYRIAATVQVATQDARLADRRI